MQSLLSDVAEHGEHSLVTSCTFHAFLLLCARTEGPEACSDLLERVDGLAEVAVLGVEQRRERLALQSSPRESSTCELAVKTRRGHTLSRPLKTCSFGAANLPLASAGGTSE